MTEQDQCPRIRYLQHVGSSGPNITMNYTISDSFGQKFRPKLSGFGFDNLGIQLAYRNA